MRRRGIGALMLVLAWGVPSWAQDHTVLMEQAKVLFGVLPKDAATDERPLSAARVDLGRVLYYDARLSKNHDVSCNSCHASA